MSLEESMKELAASNRELAAAQTHYASVIERFGLKIESSNEGKTAPAAASDEKPAKGKPGRKPKVEPAETQTDDDDGVGDDDGGSDVPDNLTAADVKAKLLEVKDAHGDKKFALDILKEYGYKAIGEVQPKDFKAVYADCVKSLADA